MYEAQNSKICQFWTLQALLQLINHLLTIHQKAYECILDGQIDCLDASDENPLYHIGTVCRDGKFRCDNGQCIRQDAVCDGKTIATSMFSCQDGSDEGSFCVDYECPIIQWKCADDLQCIRVDGVCDGIRHHCRDKSDEHNQLCGCKDGYDWPCDDGDGCVRCVTRKQTLRSLSLSYHTWPRPSFFWYDTDFLEFDF